jgi:hypothetical protein
MRKYKKIYIKKIFRRNPKITGAGKGCWNTEKDHTWLRRFKNAKG